MNRSAIRRATRSRNSFESVHRTELQESGDGAQFRVLYGLEAINSELASTAARCRDEVPAAQPGGGRSAQVLADAWAVTSEMLHRGVRMCTLYQHPARFNRSTREYAERAEGLGAAVRTVGEPFDRVIIFDRETAFIPARPDRQMAIMVREPSVVGFLARAFDRIWLSAVPFAVRNRTSEVQAMICDTRATIVRLLAEGETDEAIARRIGVSVRTCRAHIAKIYEAPGARSRCHLGILLVRSGLMDSLNAVQP